jgi:hypothetical protein
MCSKEQAMKKLLIAAAVAAFPYTANADMPAKELKDFCQDYPQKGEATTMCIGYIWGSFDSARALKAACEPAGISSKRLINLVIKRLKTQSDMKVSATSLILDAYRSEFPCPKEASR